MARKSITHLFLRLGLVSDLDPLGAGGLAGGNEMYLVLEPDSAGYVVLGPTLRLLETVHPRLPTTFFDLFTHALNRWVRVYDYRDAGERVQQLREWYEGDPESETVELPDVDGATPKCLRGKESAQRTVRGAASRNGQRPEDTGDAGGGAGTWCRFAERGETRDRRASPRAVDGLKSSGASLACSI